MLDVSSNGAAYLLLLLLAEISLLLERAIVPLQQAGWGSALLSVDQTEPTDAPSQVLDAHAGPAPFNALPSHFCRLHPPSGGERQRQGGAPRPAAMFEKQLASVLNKVLGEYVEGLDHDALSLSVWKVLPPMTSRASLPRTCHVVRRTHA